MNINLKERTIIISAGVAGFLLFVIVAAVGATVTFSFAPEGVATVGREVIKKDEVEQMVAAGVNPVIARDSAIQRAILAIAADRDFPVESKVGADAVIREAKAQVYLAKKTEQISASVSDQDVEDWYKKNVSKEDFVQIKARFYLSQSQEDANSVAVAANSGDGKAIAKYTPVSKENDGFVRSIDLPFGLGRDVAKMKAGTFSTPVIVNAGALSVVVDGFKEADLPRLDDAKVSANIKNVIIRQRLGDEIQKLRTATKVELHG